MEPHNHQPDIPNPQKDINDGRQTGIYHFLRTNHGSMLIKPNRIQRAALYLYLFSLNFEMFILWGQGTTARFTGFLYLASMLPYRRRIFRTRHIKSYLRPVILLWIYLTLISLLHLKALSPNFLHISMLLNILLFWVLFNHERIDPGVLQKGMLGFGFGAVLLTIFYYMGLGTELTGGRVSIFGDNENVIGIRLNIAVVVLMYAAIGNNLSLGKLRFVFLVPAPALLYFMLNTGSRNAFIGFLLSFSIGSLLFPMKRLWHKVMLLSLSAVMAVFIFHAFMQSEVLVRRLRQTTEQGSLGGRDEIWLTILPLIKSNLIFGVGKTGYADYSEQVFGGDNVKSPHNVLVEVLAYTGIIGLFLYLMFWWRILSQAIRTYRGKRLLLPLLLLIPVAGMMLGGRALDTKIVWAIAALVASTIYTNHDFCIHRSYLRTRKLQSFFVRDWEPSRTSNDRCPEPGS